MQCPLNVTPLTQTIDPPSVPRNNLSPSNNDLTPPVDPYPFRQQSTKSVPLLQIDSNDAKKDSNSSALNSEPHPLAEKDNMIQHP